MKHILILAPSRNQAHDFLVENQWINHGRARIVHSPNDLRGISHCLVLALPGWQHSPSITHPRTILEEIARRNMQLVALEQDVAYRPRRESLTPDEQLVAGGDPLGAI